MKACSRMFPLFLFFAFAIRVGAQPGDAPPPADIRPLFKGLSVEQKLALLDTVCTLGADVGRALPQTNAPAPKWTGFEPGTDLDLALQQTYEQLGDDKRGQVLAFLKSGQPSSPAGEKPNQTPPPTTTPKGDLVGAHAATSAPVLAVAEPTTTPRTKVRWDQDTLFFGKIEEGTILLDSFVVTNTGDNPYLIRDVYANCDCTIIKYPQKPLLPGQSAALRFVFDSTRKAGPTQPGIIVYDNSSPNARSILYLDGEVTPRKQVKVIRQ